MILHFYMILSSLRETFKLYCVIKYSLDQILILKKYTVCWEQELGEQFHFVGCKSNIALLKRQSDCNSKFGLKYKKLMIEQILSNNILCLQEVEVENGFDLSLLNLNIPHCPHSLKHFILSWLKFAVHVISLLGKSMP